ncbi:MAG: hypothetical protein ACLTBV_01525 [Enterocloster bolteae]
MDGTLIGLYWFYLLREKRIVQVMSGGNPVFTGILKEIGVGGAGILSCCSPVMLTTEKGTGLHGNTPSVMSPAVAFDGTALHTAVCGGNSSRMNSRGRRWFKTDKTVLVCAGDLSGADPI